MSNYHSIREEVALDLRIPGTAPDLPRFRRSVARPDVRLPTVAVLMGPNGSGKTTLLRALTTMARIALTASPSTEANPIDAFVPFAAEERLQEPTRFRLEIEADWLTPNETPQLFRYDIVVAGVAPDLTDRVYHLEALSHFPKGRPRLLFERGSPGESIRVSREIAEELGVGSRDGRIKAIQDDASVLATLTLLKLPLATEITKWFRRLTLSSNISLHARWGFSTKDVIDMLEDGSQAVRPWIEQHMQSSDLGIHGLEVQDVDIPGEDRKAVFFRHKGLDGPIDMYFESSGTKRLFHLLPQLGLVLHLGGSAVLDEVDGDLHVDIVGDILGWFQSRESNPRNAQLLVTSHNVGLLDDLEKEEVFIVEKTQDGATRLHGAQDVRGLRRDARLYPKYRAGVLGGIPKIG